MMPLPVIRQSFRRPRSERNAFTLLEMVATLGMLLLLAIAATSMLTSITDLGLQHRRSLQQRRAVLRLAGVLRADVHASTSVELANGQWPLRLTGSDWIVEYDWNQRAGEMRRVQRSGSDPEEAEGFDFADVFPLSEQCEPKAVITDDLVSVVLRESDRTGSWIVEAHR